MKEAGLGGSLITVVCVLLQLLHVVGGVGRSSAGKHGPCTHTCPVRVLCVGLIIVYVGVGGASRSSAWRHLIQRTGRRYLRQVRRRSLVKISDVGAASHVATGVQDQVARFSQHLS